MKKQIRFHFVIQARSTSKRLPGKVLADIGGVPLLDHILNRLRELSKTEEGLGVTLAIPVNDNPLREYALARKVSLVEGDELNVFSRFREAARRASDADYIFRLTGDNPFPDIGAMAELMRQVRQRRPDYAHTANLPLGMGAEVLKRDLFLSSVESSMLDYHKEHVTIFFRERPEEYSTWTLSCAEEATPVRLTVDESRDLALARKVFAHFEERGKPFFGGEEIRALHETNPDFFQENQGVVQKDPRECEANEGS